MRDKVIPTSEENGHSSSVGACAGLESAALLSLGPENHYGQTPFTRLFLTKYQTYPSTLECQTDSDDIEFHVTSILNYIRDEFNHDMKKDCAEKKYDRSTKQKYVQTRLCDLGNGVMISFDDSSLKSDIQNPNKLQADHADDYFLTTANIKIYHLPEQESFAEDLSNRFSEMVLFSSKSCTLQMVCRNDCGYYLRGIKIKKPLITDMGLHYGQNFVAIHDKILKNLNQKESKGIVLLHGVPGSGN